MVAESVRRWRWRSVASRVPSLAANGGEANGPFLQPILKVLEARAKPQDDWDWQQRAALKSALLNRQWPLQRLHAARLADTDGCNLCATLRPADEPLAGRCCTAWRRVLAWNPSACA